MNILITNDDGFFSPGVTILREKLKKNGHNVLVVAPHTNQSAKSHSIHTTGIYELYKHDEETYSLTGTPADTILFYDISGEFNNFKADVVISGVNKGINVSSDLIYSGTCAGAREASIRGYVGIAMSCRVDENGDRANYELASDFIVKNIVKLKEIIEKKDKNRFFININVPFKGDSEKYAFAALTPLTYRNMVKKLPQDTDECSKFAIEFHHTELTINDNLRDTKKKEICDFDALLKNTISVTVVSTLPYWDNSI